jgi:hypothetical protein
VKYTVCSKSRMNCMCRNATSVPMGISDAPQKSQQLFDLDCSLGKTILSMEHSRRLALLFASDNSGLPLIFMLYIYMTICRITSLSAFVGVRHQILSRILRVLFRIRHQLLESCTRILILGNTRLVVHVMDG